MEEREICAHRRICVCVYSRKMRSGNSSRFIVVPEYPRAARCFNSLAVSNNIRYFYRYRVYLLAKRKREGERERAGPRTHRAGPRARPLERRETRFGTRVPRYRPDRSAYFSVYSEGARGGSPSDTAPRLMKPYLSNV